MAPSPEEPYTTPSRAGSPHARDHGLRRSRRLTGWITAASVAGAAVLGSVYTQLLPGNSAAPSPPAQSSAAPITAMVGDDGEEYGESRGHEDDDEDAIPVPRPALRPPAQPPAATLQQPHTTTGAS
ncbi:hypothetical protein [Nocardia niigatensis]